MRYTFSYTENYRVGKILICFQSVLGKILVIRVQKPKLFCIGLICICQCPVEWMGEDKHAAADPLTQDEIGVTNDDVSSCRQEGTVISWGCYDIF